MKIAIILALLATLCWSTVATAFKIALQSLNPQELLLLATLTACAALLLVSIGPKRSQWMQHQWTLRRVIFLFLAGIINPASYYYCLFEAYDRLLAHQALALNYTWPLVLVCLDSLLRRYWPRPLVIVCLVTAFGGVLISSGIYFTPLHDVDISGVLYALLSALFWAVYWLLQRSASGDELINLTVSFCFASIVLFGLIAWPLNLGMQAFYGALYVGLLEMAIPFYLWSMAMVKVDRPEKIAALIYLSPVLSIFWIAIILGEALQGHVIIGLLLILIASAFCAHLRQE